MDCLHRPIRWRRASLCDSVNGWCAEATHFLSRERSTRATLGLGQSSLWLEPRWPADLLSISAGFMVAADREALQRVGRRWASRTAADARGRFGRLLP